MAALSEEFCVMGQRRSPTLVLDGSGAEGEDDWLRIGGRRRRVSAPQEPLGRLGEGGGWVEGGG